jgi:chromosome segregation ATPase
MNNSGGSFAKKKLTDAERLDQAEGNFDYVRTKIGQYDKLFQEMEKLNKRFEPLEGKPAELFGKIEQLKKDLDQTSKGHQVCLESVAANVRDLSMDLGQVRDYLKSECDNRTLIWQDFQSQLDKINEKAPTYSQSKAETKDLQEFKILLSDQLQDHKRLMAAQDKVAQQHQDEIQAIVDSIHERSDQLAGARKDIQAITVFMNTLEDKLMKKFTQHADAVNANSKDFQEQLKAAVAKVKEDILGTPASNAAIEARIMNRLEMCTLDGSNAVTIARNSQDRIKLLEKKIESLQAQLQKIELPRI